MKVIKIWFVKGLSWIGAWALIIFLIIISPSAGMSQAYEAEMDSILTNKSVEEQIEVLNQLSEKYRYNDPKKAEYFVREALRLAYNLENRQNLALTLKNLGNVKYVIGEFDTALILYNDSYNIYKIIKDSVGWSTCLNNIAVIHISYGEFTVAIEKLLEAVDAKIKLNDMYLASVFLRNIGNCYYYQGDYLFAMEYYIKSYDLTEYFNDPQHSMMLQISIGSIYEAQNDFNRALEYYQNALIVADSLNDLYFKSIILNNLGLVNYNLGSFPVALEILTKSLVLKEEIDFNQGIPNTLLLIGKIYEEFGELEKSNEIYIRCMKICYELKDKL
ncbi:MAG: hypothetical protein B6D64_15260, partial [Bacteroidetes bacterium 4484_276]